MTAFGFVMFVFLLLFMRAFVFTLSNEESIESKLIAFVIALGFMFIYPLIVAPMVMFLLGVQLSYWTVFLAMLLLEALTVHFEK